MGRVSWDDNSHEGKLIRRGIDKLAKKLRTAEDTDEIIKIVNAISTASNCKVNIAKYEKMDDKLNYVLKMLKEREPVTLLGDENLIHELPGQTDTNS